MPYSFQRWNNILGGLVGLFAVMVYVLTAEASGSFWDCGEFVSCAYKIQNAHPPGNMVFSLMGRLFIILFGDNPLTAAYAVNIMSAIASGLTIMFLFWVLTFFAQKLVYHLYPQPLEGKITRPILIFVAGVLGALSAVFTDSFWFSAVEGEVYALSACLLLCIVWLMTKWERRADDLHADRWLIFIFLLIGLSTGVHLLDLLVIPVLVMIYYFKRYADKITYKGILIAFLIGCAITGFCMSFVLGSTISWGAALDLIFVNNLGLPLFSGFITCFILLLCTGVFSVYWGRKKGKYFLELGGYAYIMLLLGYSVYTVSIIRAQVKVPINMGNPDNPMALSSYISRAQYGDKPLLYGQVFTAGNALGRDGEEFQPKYHEGKTYYSKVVDSNGKSKYVPSDKEIIEEFNSQDMMFFPRVWNNRNDGRRTQDFYAGWLGIGKVKDEKTGRLLYERAPTFGDNIRWFLSYQIGWMYMRYLMWNFVGRQNDIQGFGNARDGNVITGIDAVDRIFVGDQTKLPETLHNHASRNTMFALPFILGLIGLLFHAYSHRNGFMVLLVFFFFTGLAIMLYLNDAGPQPRERDYASAVSFLVFAGWIGFASIGAYHFILSRWREHLSKLYTLAVLLIFLCAPVLMMAQEWDDHDRSRKNLARDYAKDILSSCEKNAILFTSGDNDTYPLWYVQEVEGFRTDVRVVNTSLLGIDWYISQLAYRENKSSPFDVIFRDDQIIGNDRNYVLVHEHESLKKNEYYDLREVLQYFVANDDKGTMLTLQDGTGIHYFPTRRFFLPVNRQKAFESGLLPDTTIKNLGFRFSFADDKRGIRKDELAILAILATNDWTRPIHFISYYDDLGFGSYLEKQGMTWKLLPYRPDSEEGVKYMDTQKKFDLLANFGSGGLADSKIYLDETNRIQALSIRDVFAEMAGIFSSRGEKNKAQKLLKIVDSLMPDVNFPYGLASRYNMHNTTSVRLVEAAYSAGALELGRHIHQKVHKDLQEQLQFYTSLPAPKQELLQREVEQTKNLLAYLDQFHLEPKKTK